MTPLKARLIRRIRSTGPISVADYMTECLLDPEHGYYTTRQAIGRQGDFTTAPEISQMFGELAGLALAQCWLDQGAPDALTLAELGPGRGTLMADILRATSAVPGFHRAAQIHLVEASPAMRARQKEALRGYSVTWHHGIETLPDQPIYLIANEFFDALPIRQFHRDGPAWRERQVGVAEGELVFGLSDPAPMPELAHRLADTQDGDIVETCGPAKPTMAWAARQIARTGGAALIVDYGGWRSLGDTLQAVQAHQAVRPLAAPGQADLTAHVDFEALALATEDRCATAYTTQGAFLERLGITERARALAARLSGEALQSHIAAHRRLTHPDEMGSIFKVLALTPKGAAPFPGSVS